MHPATSIRRLFALAVLLAALVPGVAEAKRAALIIANGKYEKADPLLNPPNDARAVAALLESVGFQKAEIEVHTDLGYDAMRRALLAFSREAAGADVALVYFAGHGIGSGINYLIPVDAELQAMSELAKEAFSQRVLEDAVKPARGLKMVILDACRNDPGRGRWADVASDRASGDGLVDQKPQSGIVVIHSAMHGRRALDGPAGGNSPFVSGLVKHLGTPGEDIRLVVGKIRDEVLSLTAEQQEPFIYAALGGSKVYLVPPATEAAMAAQPAAPGPDAVRDWQMVKDSESVDVLEAFRKQHGAGYPLYDALALERVQLIKKRQAALEAPATPAAGDRQGPTGALAALAPQAPEAPLAYEDRSRLLVRSFKGHAASVLSVAFSPDGRSALSGSEDKTLRLWDVATGRELRQFAGHSDEVHAVEFLPDGRSAVSGGKDEAVKLWDLGTGKEVRSFADDEDTLISSVAVSPDGRSVLTDTTPPILWDLGTAERLRRYDGHKDFITCVALSRDGRLALSGGNDKTIKLWDAATGKQVRSFSGHSSSVVSVTFSPDGLFAMSASQDKTLKLWDLETGKEVRTLTGHTGAVFSVAFSPDGRFILSGGYDDTLRLWDVRSGRSLRKFEGHDNSVYAVAFSPDGRFALSGGADHMLKLWDVSEWTTPRFPRAVGAAKR